MVAVSTRIWTYVPSRFCVVKLTLQLFRTALPILRSMGQRLSTGEQQNVLGADQVNGLSDLLPMVKIWLYVETRSMLMSLADSPAIVDAFVRYGWLSE